jgi:hypothetical protein
MEPFVYRLGRCTPPDASPGLRKILLTSKALRAINRHDRRTAALCGAGSIGGSDALPVLSFRESTFSQTL